MVYQREYSRQTSVRLHKRRTKLNRMRDYFEAKRNRRQVDIYRKGRLDPKPATRATVARASTSTSAVTITATATRPVIKRRRRQRKSLADHTDHPYSLRSRKSADHNYASRVQTHKNCTCTHDILILYHSAFHGVSILPAYWQPCDHNQTDLDHHKWRHLLKFM